jgi:hypothetical protein
MLEAFGWGALGASALLVGALIGSVSFELVNEALKTQTVAWVGLSVLVGAATFTVGDWLLERRGGGERKDPTGAQAELQRPPEGQVAPVHVLLPIRPLAHGVGLDLAGSGLALSRCCLLTP